LIFLGVPDTQNLPLGMFFRQKKNKSGVVSVQVIDKSGGKYRLVKTIGSSSDAGVVSELVRQAEAWIKARQGQLDLDFSGERHQAEQFLAHITQIRIQGIELLLGNLFEQIGFGQIKDALFKRLVLARLCYPASKLKTTDYLAKYEYLEVDVQLVYRYMDKLHRQQKATVQRISYEHTMQVLGGQMSIVFYDVTTLYFEIEREDELRKTGFSKEGRHQHPQILLGLLVSVDAYPLAYEIFAGNKFEGHTMLPVIESFRQQYGLGKLVIIADSGLLSKQNIEQLQSQGHEFILGARIKNEPAHIQEQILSLRLENGESAVIEAAEGIRLVISYAAARARKDAANRQRGLQKLERQIKNGKLTKANINNRGYNKYLKMEGEINISIDREKFEADQKWDGLKGYLSNTTLTKNEIIENYGHLWKIEKAFRVSKNDLKIRPVYHRVQRRIEAHVCIAFAAYKVYKELERQLKEKKSTWSPEKAIEIAKTIFSVQVALKNTDETVSRTIYTREEQKNLADLFGF
jgi:transposase